MSAASSVRFRAPAGEKLDPADEAVRIEAPLDARVRHAAFDEARAEAATRGSPHARSAALTPDQRQAFGAICLADGPGELDTAAGDRKRPVFCRIGGKLMQRKAERNGKRCVERDLRPLHMDALFRPCREGGELARDELAQRRAL